MNSNMSRMIQNRTQRTRLIFEHEKHQKEGNIQLIKFEAKEVTKDSNKDSNKK